MKYPFNVRVYGILIENDKILLTDEYFHETYITKFPGGGLEFGEGTIDCLKREFFEELKLEIEIIKHFYTTDFFQQSAFNQKVQIISVYYLVKAKETTKIITTEKQFDFKELKNNAQTFRWQNKNLLSVQDVTFPIDKMVISLLKKELSESL